ncbi:lysozyme [Microvirga massiliensis]|uniref:lysozyme n=1 Tax=Microvirga massiliensis TaxID=1033741 RepID=UPI00065FD803|nr:lysozyme [Microvirga massiliensis]
MNQVDYDVAMELASHEALCRQAYKNPGDVWTWSIGITSASGHRVERYINSPQPLDHCLRIYVWALERYAEDVRQAFEGHTLTQAQFAAAVSFHFNTGGIKRATWVKQVRAGDHEAARKSFLTWNKPASIVERREKECRLFFDGLWSHDGTILEYTKVKSTGAIDWGSAKRLDIGSDLRACLGLPVPAPVVESDTTITALATDAVSSVVALALALGAKPEDLRALIPGGSTPSS